MCDINEKTVAYTTGAHISPMEVIIGGKVRWVWVVDSFDSDSFIDGDDAELHPIADDVGELGKCE
jgi:hypothetical protein